jgi:hypothetical protein
VNGTAPVGREHIVATETKVGYQVLAAVRATCAHHPRWFAEATKSGACLDDRIESHLQSSHCPECGNALELADENIDHCGVCAEVVLEGIVNERADREVDEILAGDREEPSWMRAR